MEWPYRRFLKAFDAFQRRTICDEWKLRKATHLAALYSNTNLDDEKNDRPSIVAKLEQAYDEIIARIWNGGDSDEQEVDQADDSAWQSDFMRAGRRALNTIGPPIMPGEDAIGGLP
jgi:hypothetical protein